MYLNVLSFKNGKLVQFQSKTPYSVDKLKEPTPTDKYGDWNIVTDETTGHIFSFRGSEVCTITSSKVEKKEHIPGSLGRRKGLVNIEKLKPSVTTAVTKE